MGNVQDQAPSKLETVDVFRHQKYVDADGRLYIVICLFGLTGNGKKANVELLNVNTETTYEMGRAAFEGMVRAGTLRRMEGGFQLTF